MPRQIDLFPQNLNIGHNPNNQLGMTVAQLQGFLAELPALILQAFEQAVWDILKEIDTLTGLNLVAFADAIKQLLNIGEDLLTGLLDQIPVIGPILQAITGTTPEGEAGAALQAFIQFLKDVIAVLGPIIGLGTGNPIVGALETIPLMKPLIDLFNAQLGATIEGVPGLSAALGDVNAAVNDVTALIEGIGGTVINDVVTAIIDAGNDANAAVGDIAQLLSDMAAGNIDALAGDLQNTANLANTVSNQITTLLTDTAQATIADLANFINKIQQLIDSIVNALTGGSGTGNPLSAITSALEAIPNVNVTGLFGPVDLGSSVQAFANSVAQGLNQAELDADAGLSMITNWFGSFASQMGWRPSGGAPDPNSVSAIASNVATTIANRAISKPSYMGVDPSADAVFNITTLSGASPTTVNVTASASVIGFIGTPDAGIKKSVCWLGQSTANITTLNINIYNVDTGSGALSLRYTSPNIIGAVSNVLSWNYFVFPDPDDITTKQGDWYAVELAVTGTGTYQVVGIPNHWLGSLPHPTAYPKYIAATRGSGSPPSTIASPTYSPNVPWFALCGQAGKSEHPPETTEYGSSGTYTYTIPGWMENGDMFDIAVLGGGAGGTGGGIGVVGDGGGPGSWAYATLTYGVDIPTTTGTFTVHVGGAGNGGAFEAYGSNGGQSQVTITGYGSLTGAGGSAHAAFGGYQPGNGPGQITLNNTPYLGGATQYGQGAAGNFPGGGGSGGGTNGAAGGWGAGGAVWVTSYQSAENATTPGSAIRPPIITAVATIAAPALRARLSATLRGGASIPAPSLKMTRIVLAPVMSASASAPAPGLLERLAAVKLTASTSIPTPTVKGFVSYNATGAGNVGTGSSLSWSETIGADANAVIVGGSILTNTGSPTVTATVGGTSMTLVSNFQFYNSGGFAQFVFAFRLLNPPTGAQTITVSFSGGTSRFCAANSVSYKNVASIGTAATNSGTGTAASVSASSAAGQMVAVVMSTSASGTGSFSGFNQTSRWNQAGVGSTSKPTLIGDANGATTVSFSATAPGTGSDSWGAIAIPLVQA